MASSEDRAAAGASGSGWIMASEGALERLDPIFRPVPPGFCPRGGGRAALPRRRPGLQCGTKRGAAAAGGATGRGAGAVSRTGLVGLHLRRPVPPECAAGAAARRRWRTSSPPARTSPRWPCSGCPCAWTIHCSTAPPSCNAAGCSASCPRPTCRTTASSTRRGSSTPPTMRSPPRSNCSARRCPSARSCCSRHRTWRTSSSTSRSAKTCGCRFRRPPMPRWAARRCCSTCRRRTSRSANRATGMRWPRRNRRAVWRRMPIHRPARVNRPPTWPGTASR